MARGFLSGVLWGGVVGVGVSGAASVIGPAPVGPQVAAIAPDVAQAPARIESASSGSTSSTADRAPVTGSEAPQAPAPAPDTAVALDADTLTSPAQEQMPSPSALATLDVDTALAEITANDEAAVIPMPQALAPMAPQEPDDVAIDTAPAAPPAPPQVKEVPAADEAVVVEEAPADPATETASVTQQEGQSDTPEAALAERDIGEVVPETEPATLDPQGTPADTQVADGQLAPVTPAARLTEALDAEEAEAIQTDNTTQTNTLIGSALPRIGTQVGPLVDRDTGVTIRRPGSATLGEVDEAEAQEVVAETPAAGVPDARPIRRYGAAVEPDGNKPLMSIVLIDDGSSPVTGAAGIAALRGFPYPLSFAVDTTLSDAVERMGLYRKEGFEVLAMVDLPEGAQPEDAETAFGVVLSQMDQVVGVLEGPAGGLQGSREVADQVTSILLQTGHGLLAQDKGLNTMPKLARKEGVPADPVFRDFDSKGQTAAVIRRFLDQAAFKAGQEGAVVMLGRLRPDTVSALLLWGLQDRAGKVALVPISAVLLREE